MDHQMSLSLFHNLDPALDRQTLILGLVRPPFTVLKMTGTVVAQNQNVWIELTNCSLMPVALVLHLEHPPIGPHGAVTMTETGTKIAKKVTVRNVLVVTAATAAAQVGTEILDHLLVKMSLRKTPLMADLD
jgi:hypothetical protein